MINEIMQDEQAKSIVYKWAEIDPATADPNTIRSKIASKVAGNLSQLKKDKQAPGRPDMPQFDPDAEPVPGPDLANDTEFQGKLQRGELNIAPGFGPDMPQI